MFAAILDTNVLWPSLQRDFLLSMSIEGLYRPLWSDAILAELHRHEQLKLQDRGQDEASSIGLAGRLISQMRTHFADALVTGWDGLEGSFGLPDRDDEHVLAAAVVGGANAIVTDNLKDFPVALVPRGIQIVSAREFAQDAADSDPESAARALCEMAHRRKVPQTPHELLELLVRRYRMEALADVVSPVLREVALDFGL